MKAQFVAVNGIRKVSCVVSIHVQVLLARQNNGFVYCQLSPFFLFFFSCKTLASSELYLIEGSVYPGT